MPSNPDSKSRQSSGGKSSFFSRRILREKSSQDTDAQEAQSVSSSISGSQSSRHSHQTSFTSSERPGSNGNDAIYGIATQAGVITSIPYETTSSDTKQPTSIMTVPQENSNALSAGRRDPSPAHLNKATSDFHQYPAFAPTTSNGTYSQPSGPRPQNGYSNASRIDDRESSAVNDVRRPMTNGQAPQAFNPYASDQYSSGRPSFDQSSIRSGASPTRKSSTNSFQQYPQSPKASSTYEIPLTQTTSRQSQARGPLGTFQASAFGSTSSFSNLDSIPMPQDEHFINEEFKKLMQKRDWNTLPEQARRQMEAYPAAKKWTLINQDRMASKPNEQNKRMTARSTMGYNNHGAAANRTEEEDTPEWYVRKLMDNSITSKQLESMSVSLRTQPIGWVKDFVEAQGGVALAAVLTKLNRRPTQGPASTTHNEKDTEKEYEIVKCLKSLMNNNYGADDALRNPQIIVALAGSLSSPRLNTRKYVSDVLTFLCHCGEGQGHLKVLQAFDQLKHIQGENGRFDAWMRMTEVTIDGRGKMGSMVGASDEVRSGGLGMENLLMEYAVASMLLINMIVDAPRRDLQLRCHIRAQLTGCGIKRILTKMDEFQYDVIDKQVEKYRSNEAIDYEDYLERENSSIKDSVEGEVRDMNDPVQVVDAISTKILGSKSHDYFISAMQHLLLIRDNGAEDSLRMFQLVDAMLSYVAMDRRLPDMDLKQSLNITLQNVLDKLYTDAEARQIREESLESRQIADAAIAERDDMRSQVELGEKGLVAKLQQQLEEQHSMIGLQNRKIDGLKGDLSESQRLRAQDLQRNELETRELYLMLRDAQDSFAQPQKKSKKGKSANDPGQAPGILDRQNLMDRLEMQLERSKAHAKLEGKVWQHVNNPSNKLRELREEMDGSNSQDDVLRPEEAALNGTFGTIRRKSPAGLSEENDEDDSDAEDDTVVYEEPRYVELQRPQKSKIQEQSKGYLGELVAKVRQYDASDAEDSDLEAADDGITTGPSHPSLESDEPKTPNEGESAETKPSKDSTEKDLPPTPPEESSDPGSEPSSSATNPPAEFDNSIPPPPPPPMPGFSGPPPPPPPPLPASSSATPTAPQPPLMPGFSSEAPPPPPPPPGLSMPGFSNASSAPPPPPMPGTPSTPSMPGFQSADAPPPPPPMPGAPATAHRPQYNVLQNGDYNSPSRVGLAVARPKKKLKALHWEKVDAPQVTIWATHAPTHEEKEEKYIELSKNGILDEVERLFMAREIKEVGKASKIRDKKQIISSDLMRNFHVALSKFSQMSVDEIMKLILNCDKEILENGAVMDFLQRDDMCTVPDNVSKLMAPYSKDWTGAQASSSEREQDPSELTREDQLYLYTAFELHHYWKARSRALALTQTYENEYKDISAKLEQVVSVSESLRDSESLMNVLGLILDIGNYMNDTNKQANGFKLSTLARLGMVKDEKNESSFADLVERIVRTQYPSWEGFVDEINGVIAAQKINVEQLKQDAKKYVDNINNIQMSLDSGNLSDSKKFHPQDRVSQVVQRTMKDARRKAEQMQLYMEDVTKTYDDTLVLFGEDANDENAQREFFSKLAHFIQEWKKSKEKNVALEELRKRNEQSMRRKQAGPNQALSENSTDDASGASTGAMDNLLEKLRAAAPQVKDQRDRRRRARLKDRHQVRVASGQPIPELSEISSPDGEKSNPVTPLDERDDGPQGLPSPSGEDIADQAATMLQGLQGDQATGAGNARRRSEDERMRRRRRKAGGTGSSDTQTTAEPIPEEAETGGLGSKNVENKGDLETIRESFATDSTLPTTVVSPPTPRGKTHDGDVDSES